MMHGRALSVLGKYVIISHRKIVRAAVYQSGMHRPLAESMGCAGRYGKNQPGGYAGTDKENDFEAKLL